MPRKKLEEFAEGPYSEDALKLAEMVFGLQEKLGISDDQMSAETGLNKLQIYNLKRAWYFKKKSFKRMYPSLANPLVRFWNDHLTNDVTPRRVRKKEMIDQSMAMCAVEILVAKVGMAETKKLLTKRGKGELFSKYLETLPPEKLADIV